MPTKSPIATHLASARQVLSELSLKEVSRQNLRPVSGHNTSLLLPCVGANLKHYLLKFFIPPAEGKYYPAGVRIADYARREGAFYRFLDSTDPERRLLPAPKTVVIDSLDPPRWILLEWIEGAVGPSEEVMGMDHVLDLIKRMQSIPIDMFLGRRYFPLNHWDVVSYLDRVRLMYDPVLAVIGDPRWRRTQEFFVEALRWTDARPPTMVHGDFTEQNILVDQDGQPYLIDFERMGIGNSDHDFAWLWIHSHRPQEWKRELLERHFRNRFGSERIKSEWGIRSALVYLALRRLRFAYMMYGNDDKSVSRNIGMLDAALNGGADLFPV